MKRPGISVWSWSILAPSFQSCQILKWLSQQKVQDKTSGRCSESSCIPPSTSLTTSSWTGCSVLLPLCALWYMCMCRIFKFFNSDTTDDITQEEWLTGFSVFLKGHCHLLPQAPHHDLDQRNVFIRIFSDLFAKDSKTTLFYHISLFCHLTGFKCFFSLSKQTSPLWNTILKFYISDATCIWRWRVRANQILLWHLRPQQRWLHIKERLQFYICSCFSSVWSCCRWTRCLNGNWFLTDCAGRRCWQCWRWAWSEHLNIVSTCDLLYRGYRALCHRRFVVHPRLVSRLKSIFHGFLPLNNLIMNEQSCMVKSGAADEDGEEDGVKVIRMVVTSITVVCWWSWW